MGGKKALHRRIIERIEAIPHRTYVEPFLGMGGVFLRRSWRPRLEVANDLNGEITNLFRVLQRHYPQLMEVMRFQITSRREFERLRACDPATLTDLERAARFLYLQRLAFGGQLRGVFGVQPASGPGSAWPRSARCSTPPMPGSTAWSSRTCPGRRCWRAMTARRRCSISIRPIGVARTITARDSSTATSSPSWPSAW
ncbi:DNA adenine methylase, partial [Rhodovulum sulfidophilum]|uniref:DNA adenine methylase n=1 Tax=Rhodovulum sulfidophilum TaxID=35806 RepID=UPI001F27D4D1